MIFIVMLVLEGDRSQLLGLGDRESFGHEGLCLLSRISRETDGGFGDRDRP